MTKTVDPAQPLPETIVIEPSQPTKADAQPPEPPAKVETPPPPPPRPAPPPDPMIALRAQHDALSRALWQGVARGDDADALRAALDALLKSEAMESVSVHTRTSDQWLADHHREHAAFRSAGGAGDPLFRLARGPARPRAGPQPARAGARRRSCFP